MFRRFALVVGLVGCGGGSESTEVESETTAGSTVVTDEAWEQSAWEPEPVEPEPEEETWTFEHWRETLAALAAEHRCETTETFPDVTAQIETYSDATELESVMSAHEALGRSLEEWRIECGSNVGRESVGAAVEHLTDQLERITADALEQTSLD